MMLSAKQRQIEEEIKLEQARYEQKFNFERKLEELKSLKLSEQQSSSSSKVKLPKLVISKLQGTHLDWFDFGINTKPK